MTNAFKKRKRAQNDNKSDSSDCNEVQLPNPRKLRQANRRHRENKKPGVKLENKRRVLKPPQPKSSLASRAEHNSHRRLTEEQIVAEKGRDLDRSDSEMSLVDLDKRTAGPEGAAFQSRLSNETLSSVEEICFPNLCKPNASIELFITIRNKILELWFETPNKELLMVTAISKLRADYPAHTSDGGFVVQIYQYLQRYGLINFGVYTISKLSNKMNPSTKKFGTIVVIGAGMAGLSCARQLQSFGFQVIVLEARDRVGGRIATFRKAHFIADLGAMVVTGLGGNPTSILSKQVNLDLYKIKQRCPLFQSNGTPVSQSLDEVTEREFNRLLEASSFVSHSLDLNFVDEKPMSLGGALEIIIGLQEKHTIQKQCEYQTIRIAFFDELLTRHEKVNALDREINKVHDEWEEIESYPEPRPIRIEFEVRCKERDLRQLNKDKAELKEEIDELNEALEDLEKNPPCEVYLGQNDRQVLDWHFANLEFANATPLDTLSLRHWDQDDDFEFAVKNGFSAIPVALSQGLNIKLNHAVRKIEVSKTGVKITTTNAKSNDNVEVIKAENVVVTLPLGVLKDSLRSSVSDTKSTNVTSENISAGIGNGIQFCPPLPEWKNAAISRLGFGCLNKVVLCFDKIFWDPNLNLFGHVGQTTQSRGELFMFWNFSKSPVLIALIAGNAAAVMESVSDDICIARALTVLKSIFGNNKVPQPRETVVTRWRSDVFARGSYSYVAAGSTGNDYDILSTPVSLDKGKYQFGDEDTHIKQGSRLFFAGEHTIRNYPATVHGAYLSGLREAARIANQLIGV